MTETTRSLTELLASHITVNGVNTNTGQAVRDAIYSIMPTGRTATKTVAASNATLLERANADYPCDGTADQTEINLAYVSVAAAGGGSVRLVGTAFSINGAIVPQSGVGLDAEHWYTTILTAGNGYNAINASGKTNLYFGKFLLDATTNLANDKAINLTNCDSVLLDGTHVETVGFGVFADATSTNRCERIELRSVYLRGRCNSDVLGGGPQDSNAATYVGNIRVSGSTIKQDTTIGGAGSYYTAVGMTKIADVTFDGNFVYGNLETAIEQSPSQRLIFNGNHVFRPVGGTGSGTLVQLQVSAVAAATAPHDSIVVTNNVLLDGAIVLAGISGQKLTRFVVANNIVKTQPQQNAYQFQYCDGGTVTGNVAEGVTACYYFDSCANIAVNGNFGKSANYGIRDISGVSTISGYGNVFTGITTTTYVGGSGWTVPTSLDAWPIGSVYIGVTSTSPATLLGGGTWAAFGAGRVLVGRDAADVDFDVAEETGGAKTVTLTEAQMPVHTHVQNAHSHVEQQNNVITGGLAGWNAIPDTSTNTAIATGYSTQNTTAVNQNAGSGSAHSVVQPYIVVYMWKRTA